MKLFERATDGLLTAIDMVVWAGLFLCFAFPILLILGAIAWGLLLEALNKLGLAIP